MAGEFAGYFFAHNYRKVDTMDQRNDALMRAQLDLEAESLDMGIERYRHQLEHAGEDAMMPGAKLIKAAIVPMASALKEHCEKDRHAGAVKWIGIIKYLKQFEYEKTAFIVARHILHHLGDRSTALSLATGISNVMEACLNYDRVAEEDPKAYGRLLRKLEITKDETRRIVCVKAQAKHYGIETVKWEAGHKLKLGTLLLELFSKTTGLVKLETVKYKDRSELLVVPTEATMDWLEKAHARCELLFPQHLPMVVPPQDWSGPYNGGYFTKGLRYSLIKTRNKNFLEELRQWDMPEVYSALNALQKTPWAVNTSVLNVAREVWDGGGRLGRLPQRDMLELPPKNHDTEDAEAHKAWRRKAAKVYDANMRLNSKRIAVSSKIALAEKFTEYERFYFPHALDWRGRAYPVPSTLTPQGDDLSKALLQFADGKPLGDRGAIWLAVHLANSFGVDKVSFEERLQWTVDHREAILDSAFNPLDGQRLWCEAGSPWTFLAACFEWAGYCVQGESYVSHLPVSWDGTCNGLQNFSAMLRDEVGGKATNLVPGEKPSDIYSQVAAQANALIEHDAKRGLPVALRWAGKVARRHTKRNTMTVPYSVTQHGMRDQIMLEFRKMAEEGDPNTPLEENRWEDATYLAARNYEAIGLVVVAARSAMTWLKEAASVVAQDGLPVRWVTPSGLLVQQGYKVMEGKRLNFEVLGRRYQHRLEVTGEHIDKRRQGAGISPNFIHSLDAAHMMRTVNYCMESGMHHFAMIHDSYGAHACDAEELSYQLRRAFVDQYEGDVLRCFRDQLAEQLPEELAEKLPPLPRMGTLDLAAVMQSDYFFA